MEYSRCVECKYDFQGHAEVARCPECGLVYDLSTIKIPLRRRGGCGEVLFVYGMLIVVPGTCLGIFFSAQGLHEDAAEYFASEGPMLLFGAGIVLLFLIVRRIFRGRFPHEFRLSDVGIEIVRKTRVKRYGWRDIRSVESWPARFGPPCVRIILRGFVRWNIGGMFLDFGVSKPQVRMILRQVHGAMRQHKSKSKAHLNGGEDTAR